MFRKRAFWIILIVLALAAGGGYAYYALVYKPGQALPEPVITTTQVRQGDVVISVSGSGTLVATSEATLGFEKSGYLEEVYVAGGDRVCRRVASGRRGGAAEGPGDCGCIARLGDGGDVCGRRRVSFGPR